MATCALRILLVATFSIALVIFCVEETLAILVRISFAPAMEELPSAAYQACVATNLSRAALNLAIMSLSHAPVSFTCFMSSACSLAI